MILVFGKSLEASNSASFQTPNTPRPQATRLATSQLPLATETWSLKLTYLTNKNGSIQCCLRKSLQIHSLQICQGDVTLLSFTVS